MLSVIISPNLFAQDSDLSDSKYKIQDPVHIPTQSGVDISAIIVSNKLVEEPVPVVLFYTTYHQGGGDAGEPLEIQWYNNSYIEIPVWKD